MNSPDKAFELVDVYFRAVPKEFKDQVIPGRVCWVPSLYLVETVVGLTVRYADPGYERDILFELVSETENPALFNHDPLKHPPLRKNEAFLAVKAKRRPVIVLSRPTVKRSAASGVDHDFPQCFIVAPLYTFGDAEEPYSQEFIERVKAMEYDEFLYIPKSDEFDIEESFVRFDRVQSVAKRNIRLESTMLTDDAFDLLKDWIRYYLAGPLEGTIADYRKIRMNAIKKTGA